MNEACKGKRPHISSITRGTPQENIPSKGTVKRIIFDMMTVYNKDASMSTKVPNQPMLGFWDSEKVRGIPTKSPLGNHD